jgi:hypothetical protein
MIGIEVGATFMLAKEHEVIDNHLWVILSDPQAFPDHVVIVSVTTHTPEKDQACIIERNEHPWVTHRSCISYAHSKVVTLDFLLERRDKGSIVLRESIQNGASCPNAPALRRFDHAAVRHRRHPH